MNNLRDVLIFLQNMGIYDVILPFILIFSVTFAIMAKTKILGKTDHDAKKYGVVVALVLALSTVFIHLNGTFSRDPVHIINQATSSVSIWIVGALCLLLVIGLATGKKFGLEKASFIPKFFMFAAFLVVGWIFLDAADLVTSIPFISDSSTQAVIIVLILFAAIIAFITGGAPEDPKAREKWEKDKMWNKYKNDMNTIFDIKNKS